MEENFAKEGRFINNNRFIRSLQTRFRSSVIDRHARFQPIFGIQSMGRQLLDYPFRGTLVGAIFVQHCVRNMLQRIIPTVGFTNENWVTAIYHDHDSEADIRRHRH